MAFDAEVFARWNTRSWVYLREMLRRNESRKTTPNLAPVWANALSELTNLTKRVADGMLSHIPEEQLRELTKPGNAKIDSKTVLLFDLIKRLQAFPHGMHYQLNGDSTVLIYSSDRYLERALYFGTRELPRLRPIDFLVSRMTLRLQDYSIVFIARDFRKAHEIDQDFERENLRQVSPYYA